MIVLPLSILEALGANAKGVRRDFWLHEGARYRILETLVAFGTLFLLIRFSVQEVGVEPVALYFASYVISLFIISALVS